MESQYPYKGHATVMRFETLRIVLATAASQDAMIRQFDVTSAYLHHLLREVVYMTPPPGFAHPSDPKLVWRLLKPLYGMVQGGHYWDEEKTEFMEKLGWKKLTSDPSAFQRTWDDGVSVVAVFWVDDAVCAGPEEKLLELERQFSDRYGISSEGELTWTLGIAFKCDHANRTIELSQISFIDSMLRKFSLDNATPVEMPFATGAYLTTAMSPQNDLEREEMKRVPYRELVGTLLYVMVATRPDIAYALSVLCKYMANPGRAHWQATKRVLCYLKGTRHIPLVLGGDLTLCVYSDADFAGNRDDRKSSGAYVFAIGIGAVTWSAKKQRVVALSTLEAEYIAMSEAAREATWVLRVLNELGANIRFIIIFADSQGAIALTKNPVFHNRSKHIEIQYHYTREKVANGEIQIAYISTKKMVADALTKPLVPAAHNAHCVEMGLGVSGNERGGV